ncbi:hypothetical protein [Scatolibacter rhodanostii]|uniref:hypothetical protein n=1 Tax=Scatolibacter rhodanostii TaxID=2014781 RepID=UPI000C083AE5|nr:hypothetical protein [Scatolibacter rhodanostii]
MNPVDIEKSAMHGDEMPGRLNLAEQLLFQSFRCLYHSHKTGIITREQAKKEKQKLLDSFFVSNRLIEIYQETERRNLKLAGMSKEVELGNCDRCKKIMRIMDGRALK